MPQRPTPPSRSGVAAGPGQHRADDEAQVHALRSGGDHHRRGGQFARRRRRPGQCLPRVELRQLRQVQRLGTHQRIAERKRLVPGERTVLAQRRRDGRDVVEDTGQRRARSRRAPRDPRRSPPAWRTRGHRAWPAARPRAAPASATGDGRRRPMAPTRRVARAPRRRERSRARRARRTSARRAPRTPVPVAAARLATASRCSCAHSGGAASAAGNVRGSSIATGPVVEGGPHFRTPGRASRSGRTAPAPAPPVRTAPGRCRTARTRRPARPRRNDSRRC